MADTVTLGIKGEARIHHCFLSRRCSNINFMTCFFLFQESLSISAATSEIDEAAPTLIVKENFEGQVSEVFLVSEKVMLCKIDPQKSPLYLFAAFYAFNMQYPKGLVSLYTFLEIFLFNKRPKKVPSIVSSILSCLNNVN